MTPITVVTEAIFPTVFLSWAPTFSKVRAEIRLRKCPFWHYVNKNIISITSVVLVNLIWLIFHATDINILGFITHLKVRILWLITVPHLGPLK